MDEGKRIKVSLTSSTENIPLIKKMTSPMIIVYSYTNSCSKIVYFNFNNKLPPGKI